MSLYTALKSQKGRKVEKTLKRMANQMAV